MFFDSAGLDALYEQTQGEIRFGVFDQRLLLPLTQLPDLVAQEGGETLRAERVPTLIEAGWLPRLRTHGGDLGFPLYVPGRISLLLQLERAGVSATELAAFAEYEEGIINTVLTTDDTAYEDDDLTLVIREYEDQVDGLQEKLEYSRGGAAWAKSTAEQVQVIERELETANRSLDALRSYKRENLRPELQEHIRRHAFKLRVIYENMRLFMTQADRAAVAQGYSFFVAFDGFSAHGLSYDDFEFGRVSWPQTLRSPWLTGEDDTLPIRLPGIVLYGESISLTRMMTPSEYRQTWKRYDLDGYRLALADRDGERICQRCLASLPAGSSPARKFCSTACKSQAKAETYRRRYPERVKAARHGWQDMMARSSEQNRRMTDGAKRAVGEEAT